MFRSKYDSSKRNSSHWFTGRLHAAPCKPHHWQKYQVVGMCCRKEM